MSQRGNDPVSAFSFGSLATIGPTMIVVAVVLFFMGDVKLGSISLAIGLAAVVAWIILRALRGSGHS